MDEVWQAFEESSRRTKHAWVADKESPLTVCASGLNEVECLEALTELIAQFDNCVIMAINVAYEEDLSVHMTAILGEVVYPHG